METDLSNDSKASEIEKLEQELSVHKAELDKLKAELGEGTAPTKETLQEIFKEESEITRDEVKIENLEESIEKNPDNQKEGEPEQAIEEKRSSWSAKSASTVLYDDPEIAPFVQECLNLMAVKGIYEATALARKLSKDKNPAILDAFHDFILDKWSELEAGNFIPKVNL